MILVLLSNNKIPFNHNFKIFIEKIKNYIEIENN